MSDELGGFHPILRALRIGSEQYFGRPGLSLDVSQLLARPQSDILRVTVRGESLLKQLCVKRFKPKGAGDEHREFMRERVRKDFLASQRACEALAPNAGFSAVRPVACFPDQLVLVTEEAPGQTLLEILERWAPWHPSEDTVSRLEGVLTRIGQWIRVFQASGPTDRRFSLDGMREYIDTRLQRTIQHSNDFRSTDRSALLEYFDRRRGDVPACDLAEVVVHGDLCPTNIIVDGDHITVIDFAMAGFGGIYLDVARMFTQLELLKAKPKFRPAVVARLQTALMQGFDPELRSDRALFELFVLQHTTTQFMKLTLRPGRSARWLWNRYLRRRHGRWLRARQTIA